MSDRVYYCVEYSFADLDQSMWFNIGAEYDTINEARERINTERYSGPPTCRFRISEYRTCVVETHKAKSEE